MYIILQDKPTTYKDLIDDWDDLYIQNTEKNIIIDDNSNPNQNFIKFCPKFENVKIPTFADDWLDGFDNRKIYSVDLKWVKRNFYHIFSHVWDEFCDGKWSDEMVLLRKLFFEQIHGANLQARPGQKPEPIYAKVSTAKFYKGLEKLLTLANLEYSKYQNLIVSIQENSFTKHFFITELDWLVRELKKPHEKYRLLGKCYSSWDYCQPVNVEESKNFKHCRVDLVCLNSAICPCFRCFQSRMVPRPISKPNFEISSSNFYFYANFEIFKQKLDIAQLYFLAYLSGVGCCGDSQEQPDEILPKSLNLHREDLHKFPDFLIEKSFNKKCRLEDLESLSDWSLEEEGFERDLGSEASENENSRAEFLIFEPQNQNSQNLASTDMAFYLSRGCLPFDLTVGQNSKQFEWIIHVIKCNLMNSVGLSPAAVLELAGSGLTEQSDSGKILLSAENLKTQTRYDISQIF